MSFEPPRRQWEAARQAARTAESSEPAEPETKGFRSAMARLRTLMPAGYSAVNSHEATEGKSRHHLLAAAFEDGGAGWFWETDRAGTLRYLSPKVAARLHPRPADLIGIDFGDLFHHAEASEGVATEQTVGFLLQARLPFDSAPVSAMVAGTLQWWSLTGRPVSDSNGNFCGFRGHGTDLSEQQRVQAEATRQGQFDTLTGLANRASMQQTLEQAMAPEAGRIPGSALFLLDLDKFKAVNDTFGHPAGDKLLIMVAERARRVIGEAGRVGRLGGDEFMVVFPGETSTAVLADIARSTIATLSEPYQIDGAALSIGASIGIAIAPYDGEDPESLIAHADMALYAAKYAGRGVHRLYDAGLTDAATERKSIERDIRAAVMNNGMNLAFQPFVDARDGRLTGFETLLRWRHPERGDVSPAHFLPLVDELGLGPRLVEWVIFNACREAAKWPPSTRVAVNISSAQLLQGDLFKNIAASLDMTGLHPDCFELEISEHSFSRDRKGIGTKLADLKRLGVRIALDDFGAQEISLANLRDTAIDKIKFDPSFVLAASDGTTRDAAIIRAIVLLADSLGIETLAEGIETENDAALARLLGCTTLQGFAFGTPASPEAATALAEKKQVGAPFNRDEKRAAPRLTIYRTAMLRAANLDFKVVVRNISMLGASLECPHLLASDTKVMLDLGVTAPIEARIAWAREGRMGLSFSNRFDMGLLNAFQKTTIRLA